MELYNKLIDSLPSLENDNISLIVEVLNKIDDDGCKLRYSEDKSSNAYQKKPIFIKADIVLELTQRVCEELIAPV